MSHRLTAASPSLAEPHSHAWGREGHENGILYHVCEKAIGYYCCIIDITFKVPSHIIIYIHHFLFRRYGDGR